MIGRTIGLCLLAGAMVLTAYALTHWRGPAPIDQAYHDYVEQR